MSGSIGTITLITKTGEFERKYFLNNPDITFLNLYIENIQILANILKKTLAKKNSTKIQQNKSIQSDDLLAKIYLENKITITKKII